MEAPTYRVIFEGALVEGRHPEEVKRNLAAVFKVDEAVIERRFFTRASTVVRKNVDHSTAQKYQQTLKKVGIICRIEPISGIQEAPDFSNAPSSSSAEADSPEQASSNEVAASSLKPGPKPARQPIKRLIHCPKCGFEQEAAEACMRCGIILERYYERDFPPLPSSSRSTSSRTSLKRMDSIDESFRVVKIVMLVLVLLVGGGGALYWRSHRPVNPDIGAVAGPIPEQTAIISPSPFMHKNFHITPLAEFSISARVLSRREYSNGRESTISPVDFALGWGPMADKGVLRAINVSQSGRWYTWNTTNAPIPIQDIKTHSANMHIVPANSAIWKEVLKVRKNDMIAMKGFLVQIDTSDGWFWKSSLTREDVGDGACEVVWVKAFQIIP